MCKNTICYFLFLIGIVTYGQENSASLNFSDNQQYSYQPSIGELMGQDFGNTWRGIKHFYTAPLRWEKKQYQQLGMVLGSFALISLTDRETNKYFSNQADKAPKVLKDFGFKFGGPANAVIFSTGLYTYGLFAKKNKIKKTGILMMSSIAAAGFLQSTIKTMVGRARPNDGGPSDFRPFTSHIGFHSFPSGHSVVSLVFVHSIARQVDPLWAKVALYGVGSIAPISRLWSGSHWVSDVALGSFLGILTVNYLDNYLTEIYEGKKEEKLTNVWKFQAGLANVKLSYTF